MNLFAQFRRLIPTFFLVYGFGLALILVVVLAKLLGGVSVPHLTRDPLAIVESHLLELRRNPDTALERLRTLDMRFYYGFLSNVGVVLWCATASVCLFSAAMLRWNAQRRPPAGFLCWGGIITLVLLLDDLFMLHEDPFPRYTHMNEKVLYVGYALCVLAFLVAYRETILKTDYLLLVFALGFFGFSIAADHVNRWTQLDYLFEDGAKLAGILSWSAYFVRACASGVNAAIRPS